MLPDALDCHTSDAVKLANALCSRLIQVLQGVDVFEIVCIFGFFLSVHITVSCHHRGTMSTSLTPGKVVMVVLKDLLWIQPTVP